MHKNKDLEEIKKGNGLKNSDCGEPYRVEPTVEDCLDYINRLKRKDFFKGFICGSIYSLIFFTIFSMIFEW